MFISNDQIIFNPDSILIESGEWKNYNARIVAKKGLDYYTLSVCKTYDQAKNILDDMFYEIAEKYDGLFFKGTEME